MMQRRTSEPSTPLPLPQTLVSVDIPAPEAYAERQAACVQRLLSVLGLTERDWQERLRRERAHG